MEEKEKTTKKIKTTKSDTKVTRKKKEVVDKPEVEKEVEIREVIVEKKSGFNYAEVIVIMIITLILGAVIGSFINYITTFFKIKVFTKAC